MNLPSSTAVAAVAAVPAVAAVASVAAAASLFEPGGRKVFSSSDCIQYYFKTIREAR